MKTVLFVFSLLTATLGIDQTMLAQDTGKGHKVVFQFVASDTLSQRSLITNLRNLRESWPDAEVEVVLHGGGLAMVLTEKARYASILQELVQKKNVKMVACENTMRMQKVTEADLLPFIGTVPMAMAELILKQEQGWAYLRAGL
ncbi:DsrE family protein [Fibrella arboris]|uniref:DsrE family protein n=1 Tax=Fibrella arboris TaxID=3242486 RepID=UPI003522A49D